MFRIRMDNSHYKCHAGWSIHAEEAQRFKNVQSAVSACVKIGGYVPLHILNDDGSVIWESKESIYCDQTNVIRPGIFIRYDGVPGRGTNGFD